MAVHASHAALPYPIKGARFSMLVPLLDADGDPTAQTTPDTEISEDNAAATDAAEEVSATSGMDGMGLMTFTGAETDCSTLGVAFKAASGPKTTLATLFPRVLAIVGSGTLSAGSAGGGTLGTLLPYDITGCFIKTTGGTGGGGTGGASNQARRIITYNTGTGAFTVAPNWETTPSTDTTYDVLLPEGVTLGMLKALNPTTAGRTLDVTATGAAGIDWANVENPTTALNLSGTNIDVDQVVASVSGAVGSVTGAVGSVTAGVTLANDAITAAKFDETTAFPLVSADTGATAVARTGADADTLETLSDQLDAKASQASVDDLPTNAELATSQAAADDATLAAIAALNNLSAAQVNAEVDAALVDIHLDHLLAVTYDPASKPGAADALLNELVENDGGVARYSANALEQAPTGGSAPSAADIADAVWEEAIADHSGTAGSTAEALNAAGAAGDPWTTALPGAYGSGSAGNIIGNNLNATVGSRATQTSVDDLPTNAELATSQAGADDATLAAIAALNDISAADVWAAGTRTLTSFGTLVADSAAAVWAAVTRTLTAATNITSTGGTTVPQTGDSFARLGLPAGASHAADTAAVKADTAAIKAKTDNLPAAPAAVGDVPTAAQVADKVLLRNLAGGSDGGRTVQDSLRFNRNKFTIAGSVLTVYEEDDTTIAWTAAITQTAGDPVSASDPT